MNNLSTLLQKKISSWATSKSVLEMFSSESDFPKEAEGLQGGLSGFLIAEYIKKSNRDIAIVVPTTKELQDICTDIHTYDDSIEILELPWWGTVPYRPAAKGSVIFGERASVLAKMCSKSDKARVFIMQQRAFMTPVPDPEYEKKLIFSVKKGMDFDPVKLSEKLSQHGYIRVPRVTVRGEYTLRGEVLDIFMPGEEFAHRIVFDFDTISNIKSFDPETQTSAKSFDELIIYPMKEIIWTDEMVHGLEPALEPLFSPVVGQNENGEVPVADVGKFKDKCDSLLTELLVNHETEGEELLYPLVFEKRYTVIDYMSEDIPLVFFDYDRLDNSQESFDREYLGLYRKERVERPVPAPQKILVPFDFLKKEKYKSIYFRTIAGNAVTGSERLKIDCDPPHSFFGNINYLKETVQSLRDDGWELFIFAESDNQALRMNELLHDFIHPENTDPVKKALKGTAQKEFLHILPFPISAGFGIPELKISVIQENEIFGRRKHVPHSVKHAKSAVIDTFVELNPGDFVVHVNYGIGRFLGIDRVRAMGNERDYIKLEYADEETVFIPIEQVNLVQRYIGNEGDSPRLDRIGSKSWENRKNKVKKSVEDLAEKLIQLYSKRKAARGFAFPKDTEWQTAFEAAFPYTETDDQITVSKEIKEDMEKPVPMDRLVCGDVGYGKTEMAMRAAFKAVMGGKQVAFLAPTTLLAEQHYESCKNRFENFPVRIAQLSRFVPPAEQKKTLEKLSRGDIDILIGTHRIIQKDIVFKDLGLMIIDEEQRFGVKDKEKLKVMKTNIDSLAMSATPIPRTLHMSLLKIRDMSLLTTPPQNRQAIETVIDGYNDDRVAAAIRREVERGGQVFYLHNRVEDLHEVRLKLEKLVPEMMIDVAHGQMTSQELDDIFRRFKMGGFHVLVATTIIENGIDIPNVNTIIIDRADMYGVSQLYQLRGRVGRSNRKAYAYLFYPENRALSEVAMKRLQVISDFTELGSGFKIAMKDMEIRGAGNLLGRDQSGDVYSVGFDMYLRLLESAIQRLSDEHYEPENEVLLELEYTGFIPDSYIKNSQTKMEIYKKIAAVSTKGELERVYSELEDRFGPIPDEVYSLLALAEIRIICRKLDIAVLKERAGRVQIEFAQVSKINVDKVLRLIKESGGAVKLDPMKPNVLIMMTGKIGLKEKSIFIREKLETLLV
ncbi:MAG: transcription-repair coupling factor [Treponemataceae bacterium]|nr:transcription-repair coupling factor [Treponemataceae bacterium]